MNPQEYSMALEQLKELDLQTLLLRRRIARYEAPKRPVLAPLVTHCSRCHASTPILNGYGWFDVWQWERLGAMGSDEASDLFEDLPQLTLSAIDAGWVVAACYDGCCLEGVWCPECREHAESNPCRFDR